MSTIAAISTPPGKGGIAVIRISGENALSVAQKMFIPACGCDLSAVSGGRAVYGRITCDGEMIDDGIATVFRAPRSFTGEDTVEISCHGGILLTERVLAAAFKSGAEQAKAGEFTQRAFLNGKIDLSGAEAVIGLIEAESEEKLRLCASHSGGVLKKRCDEIYARIMKLVSTVYVRIDYPEEDLSELTDAEIIAELEDICAELGATERTYKQGKAVSEGVKTAIIGKPNVGKSSLLNALVGEEKAIVTAHAGTTRDVIEDKINAGRVTLRLFDTAGIRDCDDEVEQIGVSRAIDKASEAELIVAVFDTSKMPDDQDERIISIAREALALKKPVIFVLNKSDGALENAVSAITGAIEGVISDLNTPEAIPGTISGTISVATLGSALNIPQSLRGCVKTVSASAKDGTGIEKIKEAAESFFIEGHIDYQSVAVVANARQYAAVSSARMSVEHALAAIKGGYGADVCGLDLEAALGAIGQVDGRAVSDEITNEIFHNFCVGK